MAFGNPLTLATIVQASTFQLLDAGGNLVAELGAVASFGGDDPGLQLLHAAAGYDSSWLQWTYGNAGPQTTELLGPGDSLGMRPKLTFTTDDTASTTGTLVADYAGTLQQAAVVVSVDAAGINETASLQVYDAANGASSVAIDGSLATITAAAGTSSVQLDGVAGRLTFTPSTNTYLDTRKARLVADSQLAEYDATAQLTLAVAAADVPGCTTGALAGFKNGDVVLITATADFDCTVLGAGPVLAFATITVDGVALTPALIWQTPTVAARVTLTRSWLWTATAGSHTFKLRGSKSAALGTYHINATHSSLIICTLATK